MQSFFKGLASIDLSLSASKCSRLVDDDVPGI